MKKVYLVSEILNNDCREHCLEGVFSTFENADKFLSDLRGMYPNGFFVMECRVLDTNCIKDPQVVNY